MAHGVARCSYTLKACDYVYPSAVPTLSLRKCFVMHIPVHCSTVKGLHFPKQINNSQ